MKKILFVGSFDPITNAHVDIIKRLVNMGYYVYIGILENKSKRYMFSLDKRKDLIQTIVDTEKLNAEVFSSDKMLKEVCVEKNIYMIARGLRNHIDLEYERTMEFNNKLLNDKLEYIYLNSPADMLHISSTTVRELLMYDNDISHLVHSTSVKKIKNRKEG